MLTHQLSKDAGARFEADALSSPRTVTPRLQDRLYRSSERVTEHIGVGAMCYRLAANVASPVVEISAPHLVERRAAAWQGMAAELVQSIGPDRIDYRFHAPVHLLVVCERGARYDGDTFVEGLPRSALRDFTRKLTFVPAGHVYHDWQEPLLPSRMLYFYFDPATLPAHSEPSRGATCVAPRLFFENTTLWETALKLKALIESPTSDNQLYLEALGVVLAHEVARLDRDTPRAPPPIRGGLAGWQKRIVTAYIEEHLAEAVSLATLSQLVRLSPYYFCRAFKQSFGIPPHRYHTSRRIERAKLLLANPTASVTEIGFTLGFSQTSSFTAAFRKAVGLTPSGYRRNLA